MGSIKKHMLRIFQWSLMWIRLSSRCFVKNGRRPCIHQTNWLWLFWWRSFHSKYLGHSQYILRAQSETDCWLPWHKSDYCTAQLNGASHSCLPKVWDFLLHFALSIRSSWSNYLCRQCSDYSYWQEFCCEHRHWWIVHLCYSCDTDTHTNFMLSRLCNDPCTVRTAVSESGLYSASLLWEIDKEGQ